MLAPAILFFSRPAPSMRSEEHTSELQSLTNLVCRLLLEKKNRKEKPFVCNMALRQSQREEDPRSQVGFRVVIEIPVELGESGPGREPRPQRPAGCSQRR